MMNGDELLRQLGVRLRAERKKAGLSQDALAKALGHTGAAGHAYVSKVEQGRFSDVGFLMLTRYLQICKTPVGRFMLELARSGAFGEPEQGLTIVEEGAKERATKQRRRRDRKAQDAHVVSSLWNEVLPAILPLLPPGQSHLVAAYLYGVRKFYRAWKLIKREAKDIDPTPLVRSAFDRVERLGIESRQVPAAVRKMREVIFERLCGTAS